MSWREQREIQVILKKVDLSSFTIKMMMSELSDLFGGAVKEVKEHKKFIKEEVALQLSNL